MAKTTISHSLPYPEAADDATPHVDIKLLAEALDTELDQIAPGQIVGPTAGQLLIANSSGKVTGVAMSGDGTISAAGALTLGTGKITTGKLGDKAVTTAKLDDGAVTTTKLGTGSVTRPNIVANAIGSTQVETRSLPSSVLRHARSTATQVVTSSADASVSLVWIPALESATYEVALAVEAVSGNGFYAAMISGGKTTAGFSVWLKRLAGTGTTTLQVSAVVI